MLRLKIFATLALFISQCAFAENRTTLGSSSEALDIIWYRPVFSLKKDSRTIDVVITGVTKPGAHISVPMGKVPYVSDVQGNGEVLFFPHLLLDLDDPFAVAEEDGYFRINVTLPVGTVHLPVEVSDRGTQQKSLYQVHLKVNSNSVAATNLGQLGISPEFGKRMGLWLGTGLNLLTYSQSSSIANLDFGSLSGPAWLLRGWYKINDQFEVIPTYKSSPGGATASDSIGLGADAYTWDIIGLEASYGPPKLRGMLLNKFKSRINLLLGVQYHIVPFITRVALNQVEIQTNTFTAVAAGAAYLANLGSQWAFEAFLRYQLPVQSGSLFEISPIFAFDGSVGGYYRIPSKGLRYGLFWYGQFHTYNFTHTDPFTNSAVTGSQSLFFSNIEFRFGYEFN